MPHYRGQHSHPGFRRKHKGKGGDSKKKRQLSNKLSAEQAGGGHNSRTQRTMDLTHRFRDDWKSRAGDPREIPIETA